MRSSVLGSTVQAPANIARNSRYVFLRTSLVLFFPSNTNLLSLLFTRPVWNYAFASSRSELSVFNDPLIQWSGGLTIHPSRSCRPARFLLTTFFGHLAYLFLPFPPGNCQSHFCLNLNFNLARSIWFSVLLNRMALTIIVPNYR